MKSLSYVVPLLIVAIVGWYVWTRLKPAPEAPEAPLSTAWMAEREEIRAQIAQMVQEELDRQVTYESIVEELNANMPLNPPWAWPCANATMLMPDVEQELLAALRIEAEQKYPPADKDKIVQDARRKYTLYQPGEHVSFVLRDGIGANTKVEGVFATLSPERIRVGNRWVHRKDLDAETSARFYEAENGPAIERMIVRETSRFDAIVESYIFDEKQARLPAQFLAAGYVPDFRIKTASFKNPNASAWLSRQDAIDIAYMAKRKVVGEQLKKIITKEIFESEGYVWVASQKDWEPSDYVEAKQRRAQRQSQNQQQQSSLSSPHPGRAPQRRAQREPTAVEFVVTDGNTTQRQVFYQ
ncbi:MAG: hypothetical protein PHT80_05980 [Lentisphaeria bacterium]|nr:hypothetical protein [Lentisphaeria bacterium]